MDPILTLEKGISTIIDCIYSGSSLLRIVMAVSSDSRCDLTSAMRGTQQNWN